MMLRRLAVAWACLLASSAAAAAELPGWLSKVSVHGYVAQAYAVSEAQQILGITPGGTTEYRDLALQFRYEPNRRNSVAAQLRHQRYGEYGTAEHVVELDWAFYQRNFSDRVSVKAGRIPLPLGIFNEAGGAVTTSPFFQPPAELYERQYTSRALEGVLTTVSLGDPAGWSFDVDAYGGRWTLEQEDGARAEARDAYGAQVWANTPWAGVRFGGGAYRCTFDERTGLPADYLMLHASVEADFDRWMVASEYLTGDLDTYGRYHAWYVQAGVQASPRFSVHLRRARSRIHVPADGPGSFGGPIHASLSDDFGLALNYAIRPAVVLKLEGHTNVGLLSEDRPRDLYEHPSKTRYLIASVVFGF
jgi:hypothetical protein